MNETFFIEEVDKYLAKKNAGENVDFKYTWFHFIVAALAKTILLRPRMNYFISGHRYFERKTIQIAFIIKREFKDESEETAAKFVLDPNGGSPVEQVHDYVKRVLHEVRAEKKEVGITNALNVLRRLPRPIFRIVTRALKWMDYHGCYPKSLAKDDPNYSSVFVTNLGSIKINAEYHHMFDWGNNSIFVVINEKKKRPIFKEDGSYEMRDTIRLGFTIDERIADGYYFSKTLRLLRKIFANPELLDLPASTPIDFE